MASSAMNVFSGIAAAAAGLAGEKVAKDGSVPGLDLATIIPALLSSGGKTEGTASSLLGKVASAASKSGLLTSANIGKVADLAGTLLSISSSKKAAATTKTSTAAGGIAELAAAIVGNTGGSSLGTVATLASKLAGTVKTEKEKTSLASELGKTLSSSFGVSLNGTTTVVKALDKVLDGDAKSAMFTSILKGLISK